MIETLATLVAIFLIFLIFRKKPTRTKKYKGGGLLASVTIQADPILMKKAAERLPAIIKIYVPYLDERDILKLQNEFIACVSKGLRDKSVTSILINSHAIPHDIAPQLARHTSSYLLSKYGQCKHEKLGVRKYKWSHGHNGRNGCNHEFLNNKIFEYRNPPVVDKEGNRANPGEIYPCTCVAVGLLDD